MEDNKIIDLYFSRDESAIEETDKKYGRYLGKIAYNILCDPDLADSCKSDTYIRAWQKIPPTLPRILSSFLAKITRNIALDRYRSINSKKRGGSVELSLDELSECVGEDDLVERLEISELSLMISDFLKTERALSRGIFVRRYFYGESISEISKFYLISESNTKTILSRTRKKLAAYLEERQVSLSYE